MIIMWYVADESHPPVPVSNFTEYYAQMMANDGDDVDEEYQVWARRDIDHLVFTVCCGIYI